MKRMTLISSMIFILSLTLPAQAIMSPIGPTIVGEEGDLTVGVDYFRSQEDIKLDNYGGWSNNTDQLMKLQTSGTYLNLGRFMTDNCQIYIRAGVSQGRNKGVSYPEYNSNHNLGGTSDAFSGGGGVKWAKKVACVTWAAQAQIMYHSFGFHAQNYEMSCFEPSISGKARLYSAQLIFSALYDLNDHISIYGGPVFNFVGGSLKTETNGAFGYSASEELDISERSNFGGHIGALIAVNDKVGLYGEGGLQASDGAWFACGARLLIR